MKKTILVATLATVLAVSSAHALTIGVEDNIAADTLVTASSLNGSFNINSVLPGGGLYTLPYAITSASISFSFTDNADNFSVSTTAGASIKTATNSNHQGTQADPKIKTYLTYVDTVKSNPLETVQIGIGDQFVNGSTGFYGSVTPLNSGAQSLTSTVLEKKGSEWWLNKYYTQNRTSESGYKGDVGLYLDLDSNGLNDLAQDGILNFTLTSLAGDINYLDGKLSVTIDSNPVVLQSTSIPQQTPVPEPGTIALLGSGLLGLAIYGKRRVNRA